MRRIKSVEPKPGYRLVVTWDDVAPLVVSFVEQVKLGRIFTPLADEGIFARVRVASDRRTVEWPEPTDDDGEPLIDVDAETLLSMALEQRTESWFYRLFHQFRNHSPSGGIPPQNPPAPHPAGP